MPCGTPNVQICLGDEYYCYLFPGIANLSLTLLAIRVGSFWKTHHVKSADCEGSTRAGTPGVGTTAR